MRSFALLTLVAPFAPILLAACGDDDGASMGDAATPIDAAEPLLPPQVETTLGPVVGERGNGYLEFLGIPYAAPPLGELRFERPQPHPGWTEPLDATARPARCEQQAIGIGVPGDEDCLVVNVHTPSPLPAEPAPVMFWIHGGAFVFGEGTQTDGGTKGDRLARDHGVVVVSVNYRLGPYGFMAHPALEGDAALGNQGLWDQLAALEWVRDNIASFGGDPENVTLFGESAGGVSVCALMVADQAAGLFDRVISQSGLCDDPLPTLEQSRARAEALATELGCAGTDAEVAACLRAAAPEAIETADASADVAELGDRSWWATIDGELVTADFRDRLAAGAAAGVPAIVGWNADEGTLFVFLAEQEGEAADAAAYDAAMADLATRFGVDEAAVRAQYPMDPADPGVAIAAALGDATLACPSRRAALLLADRGPTFAYYFTYPEPGFQLSTDRDLGAFHSGEIQFVFGHPATIGQRTFTGDEVPVHDAMSAYWTAFATAGVPGDSGGLAWPTFDAAEEQAMGLDAELAIESAPSAEACALWDAAAE